ncbi:hypothetical protein IE81DRAFT_325984 [Ceraceosorus guamensis]|uniref:ZZ-type domain-containing protein n=1 Tax=Ceraceosorus guamensis TaxID=1522189 RepID=A0A316VU70_9BASI|nr:hypothetical protein IE81DRAFT_325984 [Ceraceosorus guamensis]PWN39973.1 hypothetical protein IE81DRAFT_325984 [Ceraceosorus guamensis]
MQAQAQAHDLQAMHLGRFCDSCLGCICGTRYSCDTCPDFDLCEACYTGIRHPHDFISYRPASDVQADELCHIEWKLSLTEHEAYCDCCGEDILGIRLQCVDCKRADRIFDLCDQCFSEPPLDFSHPEDHAFATVRFAS